MSDSRGKILDLRSVFGLTATITTPAEVTDGAYVVMDVIAEPGSRTTIHMHPEQDETYEVLEGTLDVLHDGRWNQVSTGETFTVPTGDLHGFRNTGSDSVRFVNTHRPALQFQTHLETLDQLVRDGKIKGINDPKSLAYMCVSATTYRPDRSVRPPQRLVDAIGWIGRRLGIRLPEVSQTAA